MVHLASSRFPPSSPDENNQWLDAHQGRVGWHCCATKNSFQARPSYDILLLKVWKLTEGTQIGPPLGDGRVGWATIETSGGKRLLGPPRLRRPKLGPQCSEPDVDDSLEENDNGEADNGEEGAEARIHWLGEVAGLRPKHRTTPVHFSAAQY